MFQENQTVLFQGDSITDAGRNRENAEPNISDAMGKGYALMAGAALLSRRASLNLQVYNRGVGGNVVGQMEARWQEDCLALKPDVLSILIGINDTARPMCNAPDADTPEGFDRTYRKILDDAKAQNPSLRLVLCEPFGLLTENVTEDWMPGLRQRQAFAKQIAADYDAIWVPFQQLFDDAIQEAPTAYWMPDGVHPTPAGHYRMAQMWLDAVGCTS